MDAPYADVQNSYTHLHIRGAGKVAWQEALAQRECSVGKPPCERISLCTVLGQGTQLGTGLVRAGFCPTEGRLQYGTVLGVEETNILASSEEAKKISGEVLGQRMGVSGNGTKGREGKCIHLAIYLKEQPRGARGWPSQLNVCPRLRS